MRYIKIEDVVDYFSNSRDLDLSDIRIKGCLDPFTNPLHFGKIGKYSIKSKIRFFNSIFENALFFENFQFDETVEFINCIFNDRISFKNSNFSENILFSGVKFQDIVNFEGANFLKNVSFQVTRFSGDAIFAKSNFAGRSDFSRCLFELNADFYNTIFEKGVSFAKTLFKSLANFESSVFKQDIDFSDAILSRANLKEVIFEELSNFEYVKFLNDADISHSIFKSVANFRRACFKGSADFSKTSFNNNAHFNNTIFFGDSNFVEAKFCAKANFNMIKLLGEKIIFKKIIFKDAPSQEYVCKLISTIMASKGDTTEQDNFYFLQMQAKRRQNGIEYHKNWSADSIWRFILYNILEFIFIQCIFGYGVRPKRLIVSWFIFIALFSLIYSLGEGVHRIDNSNITGLDYLYFSIMNAATPGYSSYETRDWIFTLIAGVEALIGTFIWATFIATFARKFMR